MRHDSGQDKLAENDADRQESTRSSIRPMTKHVVRKRMILLLGCSMLISGLNGCMIVDSPIKGMLGTEVIWGDIATASKTNSTVRGPMREGKACAESILGLLARGDASVRAAKAQGRITEVTTVDHSARNLFNIVGEWCTIVKGY